MPSTPDCMAPSGRLALLRALAACILALPLIACDGCDEGSTDEPPADGGRDAAVVLDDAEVDMEVQDLGGEDLGPDGAVSEGLQVERWGARMWGAALALTPTADGMFIGTRSVTEESSTETVGHGQLIRVDRDRGEVRVWDELPVVASPVPLELPGPTSTAGVVLDGDRILAATPTGILVVEGDSAAITAAGGLLSPIIPPSMLFVLFGVMAQVPIAEMFIAGLLPGLLLGASFFVVIALVVNWLVLWGLGARMPRLW